MRSLGVDARALVKHSPARVRDLARVVEVAPRAVGAPGDGQVFHIYRIVDIQVQEAIEARGGLGASQGLGDGGQIGAIYQVVQVDIA